MKLCKDCKHFRANPPGFHLTRACARKGTSDLIEGRETLLCCHDERYPRHTGGKNCGHEGRHWESH